jgi:hypothetical protein
VEEVPPVEVLHCDVEQAVGLLAEVDDLHRARMVQPRRGLGLALEARGEQGVARVLAVHQLHGVRWCARSRKRRDGRRAVAGASIVSPV